MKRDILRTLSLVAVVAALGVGSFANAQETVNTRIGKLEFEHGFPANSQTVAKLYDEMDFQRACQAYLWAVPAVSFQSFQTGFFHSGVDYNDVVIFDNFLDTKTLALTGNNTTIYALSLINLAKDGPVVIEVPPGPTAGMVDDYWQRSQAMIGRPGPDKGQGGKFLLVPAGYQGELPADGYFIVRASMAAARLRTGELNGKEQKP